jgi:ArsR family transcriptional regulator, arsenate/arsenite/antimonite-responsive transcriptional repressor
MKGRPVSVSPASTLRSSDTRQRLAAACCTPLAAPEVGRDQAVALADLFKALADPNRVRIVNLLANADEPVCVCEFMEPLGLAQPTVSFHLAKLHRAGLLQREQRGTWAYYSLHPSALARLAKVLDPEGGTP